MSFQENPLPSAQTLNWLNGQKTENDLPGPMGNWVSVRDVSLGHIRALEVEEAGGQRYLVGAGKLSGQAVVDVSDWSELV